MNATASPRAATRPAGFRRAMPLAVCLALMGPTGPSAAATLDKYTEQQLASALRGALAEGAAKSTAALGAPDGYLKNPKVRIPLPPPLKRLEGALKTFGLGKEVKALEVAMNRAAEAAVPEAKAVVLDSIKRMTLADAKGILQGPDDAATQYFRRSTQTPLSAKLLPLVKQATGKVGVARSYAALVERGARYGVIDAADADLDAWVTRKALDGLYLTIAEHERAIRKDPLGQGSKLLRDVFGAL